MLHPAEQVWKRPWGALYFACAAILSAGVVELMKNTIGRPRPAEALINVGFGSYPSGHSARAAMIAVALGILLPHLWVRMLGAPYTLGMMFSRTQLGARWLTDTVAGALTGAALLRGDFPKAGSGGCRKAPSALALVLDPDRGSTLTGVADVVHAKVIG